MYFYELHEADDELFSEVLLAHDAEYDEQELLELVLEARQAVLETFKEDSLIEAVANELARRHSFLHIDDSQLRVAINVSANEGETAIVPVEERGPSVPDEEENFRTLLVDVEPEEQLWRDN